jgi:parvulin-like peptidyl-prolyl isomerase
MTKNRAKLLSVCVLLIVAAVAAGLFYRWKTGGGAVLAYIFDDPLTKAEYHYCLSAALYDVAPYLTEETIAEYLQGDVGGVSAEEALKSAVLENAVQVRAVENKYAELGFDFEAHSADAYEEMLQESFAYYGGEESLRKMLKADGLDYRVFERQQRAAVMADVLEYELFQGPNAPYAVTEDEMRAAYEANYARVKHILLPTSDENAQPLTEEARAERKALGESLLARMRAGEDMDALIEELGEAPYAQADGEAYLFARGEADSVFEEAAFSLAPGEISELAESRYGFHIIKRYPLEYGADYEEIAESLRQTARSEKMGALMKEWTESAEVEIFEERIERDESLSPEPALKRMVREIAEQQEQQQEQQEGS